MRSAVFAATIDAASATADARAADLQDVLVTLTAEVALDYVDIRSVQRTAGNRAIANAGSRKRRSELTQFRVAGGPGHRP